MNEEEMIKPLTDNTTLILLAEIGALLHDIGKLHESFIESKSLDKTSDNKYKHEKILNEYPSLDVLMKCDTFLEMLNNPLLVKDKNTLSLDRFIKKHHDNVNNSLVYYYKLLSSSTDGVDGIDSGVDKGLLHKNGRQALTPTYISTSFGFDKNEVELPNLKLIRDNICKKVESYFDEIIESQNRFKNDEISKKQFVREIIRVRRKMMDSTKPSFLKALGDTRRSGNDVTLWDHSYSVASLYKAAIAKIIYENKWTEPGEIKWKIIGVQYDKLRLIEKAHKLTDIVGYRNLTEIIDKTVKVIIEEKIPIGNEIYRDETGIYFVGPSIDENEEFLEKNIREKISEAVDKISDGEVIPYVAISKSSRSLVILTELLKESTKNFSLFERIPPWKNKWQNATTETVHDRLSDRSFCRSKCKYFNKCVASDAKKGKRFQIDVCPVCKVHPKCEHQEVCMNCLNRRKRRINNWLSKNDGLNYLTLDKYQTIWINEIADSNKNAAIITGRFNLDNWLNGEFLNTVFSQTLDDYKDEFTNWDNYIRKLDEDLKQDEKDSQILKNVAKEAYKGDSSARQFYDKIVIDRNPLWESATRMGITDWETDEKRKKAAEYLLLTIFRKHPSPSRLRRIWTSTEDFWIEVRNELKEDQGIYSDFEPEKNLENRFKRLEIMVEGSIKKKKGVYNLNFENIDLLSYYDGNKFVSIQNLQHLGLQTDLSKYRGKQIKIKSEDEKDSEFKSYRIEDISPSSKLYRPFLEVLLSPITFQFIVPANSVTSVIKKIKEKYDQEMGNVAGRLPLNLGVVFFDYNTALYAAVNASRRVLKGFENAEFMDFSVKNISSDSSIIDLEVNCQGKKGKKVQLKKGSHNQSKYYFNFFVESSVDGINERKSFFKTFVNNEEEYLINGSNVDDLASVKSVKLYPNYFDFEYLDTTARRLEINYDDKHKRISKNSLMGSRPYLLEEFFSVFEQVWNLLDKSTMTTSQLKNIQSNLVKLHMDWKGCENDDQTGYKNIFQKQIENILINVGSDKWWKSLTEGERELLKDVCFDKTIFDILEFYNSVLKLKPSGDKIE